MAELPDTEQKRNKAILCIFIFVCFFFSFILIWLYLSRAAPFDKGELADSDCYMRLVRVSELYHNGCWYDPVCLRSNAPYGEKLHWTRPFDVLLLLGAVPLSLVIGFKSALFWWAVIISPVLLALTVVALCWSVKPILYRDSSFLIVFILFFQPIMLCFYQAGRPDHHSLLVFIYALSVGFALRMILRAFNLRLCYIAGVISALSIWVSVESLLPTCITLAMLGVFWFLENSDFLKKCLHYSLSLFIFTCISMVLERPWYDFVTVEYDRMSVVHCVFLGLICLFWSVVSIFNCYSEFPRFRINRLILCLSGLAIGALIMPVLFPKFYKGPHADVNPEIISTWIVNLGENKPFFPKSDTFIVISFQIYGMALVCLPFLLYLILGHKTAARRKGWIYILISLVSYFPIAFYQIRWTVYVQVLLTVIMADMVGRILSSIGTRGNVFFRALLKGFVVMSFSFIFLIIGMLADRYIKGPNVKRKDKNFSVARICEYLTESERLSEQNRRILTHIDLGPEILYRTDYEVIGTPYHRNGDGIIDTFAIMKAETNQKAFELIQKRKIDLILLCPELREAVYYSKPEQESTFYQRLLENAVPDWLRKLELPSDLSSSFILFEVISE